MDLSLVYQINFVKSGCNLCNLLSNKVGNCEAFPILLRIITKTDSVSFCQLLSGFWLIVLLPNNKILPGTLNHVTIMQGHWRKRCINILNVNSNLISITYCHHRLIYWLFSLMIIIENCEAQGKLDIFRELNLIVSSLKTIIDLLSHTKDHLVFIN